MRRVIGTVGFVSACSATLLLMACSGETADTDAPSMDANLWLPCAESRGSLFEFSSMKVGQKPLETSVVNHGGGMMRTLAKEVSAPAEVIVDLDAWDAGMQRWLDTLRAIPPRIENGRFVEPDTGPLDRALLVELGPVSERLGMWVESVCPAL